MRTNHLAALILSIGMLTSAAPSVDRMHVASDRPVAAVCDSLPAPQDTTTLQVFVVLEAPTRAQFKLNGGVGGDTVPDAFRALLLQGVRQNFVPPTPLSLPVYLVDAQSTPPSAAPGIFGEVMFSLSETGGLIDLQLAQSSLSASVDASLLGALRRADLAQALPLPQDAGKAKVKKLYVTLGSGHEVPAGGVLLFPLRVPVWHAVTSVAPDSTRPGERPKYPYALARKGFTARLDIQFVVDEHGDVVPSTVSLIHSSVGRTLSFMGATGEGNDAPLNQFALAVIPTVRTAHYVPATVGGCPIKSLVVRTFTFGKPWSS